jgi:CRP-like cAMP-binding protein
MICEKSSYCLECCCTHKPALFKDLNPDQKSMLFGTRREVEYKEGEVIFKQGTSLTHIACNKDGIVKMVAESPNGEVILMRLINPGELFGGMGLYVEEVNQTTCIALTKTKVCLIPISDFKYLIENNHDVALELIKRINHHAIKSKQKTLELTTQSMYGRVSSLLLYLADEIYKSDEFTVNLSRQDMAELTALAKESLIRVFKEFKESHYIEINKNSFRILNRSKLINFTLH